MSSVIAFCELHSLTRMLNLLRHCGPLTSTQEVFALDLLEEVLANDPVKMAALSEIKKAVHPVEKAKQFRATVLRQDTELAAIRESIKELENIIEGMRMEEENPAGKIPKTTEDDTQIVQFESQDAQVVNYDSDSAKTQPEEATNQCSLLKQI
jgi:hypothetical protein